MMYAQFMKRKDVAIAANDPYVTKIEKSIPEIMGRNQQHQPNKTYHRQQQQQQSSKQKQWTRKPKNVTRVCVDVLNKCTMDNAVLLVRKSMSGVSSTEDARNLATLLVNKTEFHPQYSQTYVTVAKTLCELVSDFRSEIQSIISERCQNLMKVFPSIVQHDQVFMNRLMAYIAFEKEGFIEGFEKSISDTASDSIASRSENVEMALKVIKYTKRVTKAQIDQMFPGRNVPDSWPPKHRFLAMDILHITVP